MAFSENSDGPPPPALAIGAAEVSGQLSLLLWTRIAACDTDARSGGIRTRARAVLQQVHPNPCRCSEKDSHMSIESRMTGLASKIHRRVSGRWRRDPVTPAENRSQLPTSQWYRGYSDEDMSVFDAFPPVPGNAQPGFIVDFLGIRTRVAY